MSVSSEESRLEEARNNLYFIVSLNCPCLWYGEERCSGETIVRVQVVSSSIESSYKEINRESLVPLDEDHIDSLGDECLTSFWLSLLDFAEWDDRNRMSYRWPQFVTDILFYEEYRAVWFESIEKLCCNKSIHPAIDESRRYRYSFFLRAQQLGHFSPESAQSFFLGKNSNFSLANPLRIQLVNSIKDVEESHGNYIRHSSRVGVDFQAIVDEYNEQSFPYVDPFGNDDIVEIFNPSMVNEDKLKLFMNNTRCIFPSPCLNPIQILVPPQHPDSLDRHSKGKIGKYFPCVVLGTTDPSVPTNSLTASEPKNTQVLTSRSPLGFSHVLLNGSPTAITASSSTRDTESVNSPARRVVLVALGSQMWPVPISQCESISIPEDRILTVLHQHSYDMEAAITYLALHDVPQYTNGGDFSSRMKLWTPNAVEAFALLAEKFKVSKFEDSEDPEGPSAGLSLKVLFDAFRDLWSLDFPSLVTPKKKLQTSRSSSEGSTRSSDSDELFLDNPLNLSLSTSPQASVAETKEADSTDSGLRLTLSELTSTPLNMQAKVSIKEPGEGAERKRMVETTVKREEAANCPFTIKDIIDFYFRFYKRASKKSKLWQHQKVRAPKTVTSASRNKTNGRVTTSSSAVYESPVVTGSRRWPSALPMMQNNLYWIKNSQWPCLCLGLELPQPGRQSEDALLKVLPISCNQHRSETKVSVSTVEPLDEEIVKTCSDNRTTDFALALMQFAEWELKELESGRMATLAAATSRDCANEGVASGMVKDSVEDTKNTTLTSPQNSKTDLSLTGSYPNSMASDDFQRSMFEGLSRWYQFPPFIMSLIRNPSTGGTWRRSAEKDFRGGKTLRKDMYFKKLVQEYLEIWQARGAVSDPFRLIDGVYPWDDEVKKDPSAKKTESENITIGNVPKASDAESTLPKAEEKKIESTDETRSNSTKSSSSMKGKGVSQNLQNMNIAQNPPATITVPTKKSKFRDWEMSRYNIYWITTNSLPALFIEYVKNDNLTFKVHPVCCSTYHYPAVVTGKSQNIKVYEENCLRSCADELTQDFALALVDFAKWRLRMLRKGANESSSGETQEASQIGLKEVYKNVGENLSQSEFERRLEDPVIRTYEDEESFSPVPWPQFILNLVNKPDLWKAWRKSAERKARGRRVFRRQEYLLAMQDEYLLAFPAMKAPVENTMLESSELNVVGMEETIGQIGMPVEDFPKVPAVGTKRKLRPPPKSKRDKLQAVMSDVNVVVDTAFEMVAVKGGDEVATTDDAPVIHEELQVQANDNSIINQDQATEIIDLSQPSDEENDVPLVKIESSTYASPTSSNLQHKSLSGSNSKSSRKVSASPHLSRLWSPNTTSISRSNSFLSCDSLESLPQQERLASELSPVRLANHIQPQTWDEQILSYEH